MGQMLVREVQLAEGCTLAGGTEKPGHTALGQDVAEAAGLDACGLAIMDDKAAGQPELLPHVHKERPQ